MVRRCGAGYADGLCGERWGVVGVSFPGFLETEECIEFAVLYGFGARTLFWGWGFYM